MTGPWLGIPAIPRRSLRRHGPCDRPDRSRPDVVGGALALGYSAQASTVDLWTIEPGPLAPKDSDFKHTAQTWLFDVGMLALLTVVYAGFVGWRSRLKRH